MTLPTLIDTLDVIADRARGGEPFCIVEGSTQYPGGLVFSVLGDQESFVRENLDFLSRFSLLNELFMLGEFTDVLVTQGYTVVALPTARTAIDDYQRWLQPLQVEGLVVPGDGELYPFQQFALNRAFEATRPRAKVDGFFFNFGTGCIQGDAMIGVNRAGKGFQIKLQDLVRRFNNEDERYKWDLSVPTYVQREVDGVVRLGKIRNAWHSGVKQTYTVTTDSGRTIRATDEHPFLTERGWLRLDQLTIGELVHVRGSQRGEAPRKEKAHYRMVQALTYHPHAGFKGRVAFHRLVAEAELNGITVEQHIRHVRLGEVIGLQTLDPDVWAVHHRDSDHTNNSPQNLEVVTHEDHHRQHAHDGKTNSVLYKVVTECVTSVEPYGMEETYDLEVDDDPHNFIANGFVVHNTGKTMMAAAGAQELVVNRGEVDLVLFFTLRKLKINMMRAVEGATELKAMINEGTPERRRRRYQAVSDGSSPERVLIMNYEKAHVDLEPLKKLVAGRRVLFVFDEVQKILRGTNNANRARKGMNDLVMSTAHSTVWPMSASVVKASPFRYHDAFEILGKNPLGTRKDFLDRYCEKVSSFTLDNGVVIKNYDWDTDALAEVRHRVAKVTQPVRKTDPGVREFFKGMQTVIIPVQQSDQERKLYDLIAADLSTRMDEDPDADLTVANQYIMAMRFMCNTPAALKYSDSQVAQEVVARYPKLIDTPSTKFEMICEQIQEIRDQGDQVVVFTQWTYLTLFLLAKELRTRKIPYVTHYGTGMTDREAQQAQDTFKNDPDMTVFLSSDAGAYGLNFQNARYVINVEAPYDPDVLMQRNDRIDRSDSHLEGLTAYIYVTDDSVEEHVWKVNQDRRAVSAATQGTVETLSRLSAADLGRSEGEVLSALVLAGR